MILKTIAVLALEKASVERIIPTVLAISFSGQVQDPATLVIFRMCGLLQWIAFWTMLHCY
jgi:hypothetical protein